MTFPFHFSSIVELCFVNFCANTNELDISHPAEIPDSEFSQRRAEETLHDSCRFDNKDSKIRNIFSKILCRSVTQIHFRRTPFGLLPPGDLHPPEIYRTSGWDSFTTLSPKMNPDTGELILWGQTR